MINYTSATGAGGGGTAGATWSSVTVGGGGGGGGGGGYTYVKGAAASCCQQGCRAEELEGMLASTLNITQELLAQREKAEQMEPTKALWCEQGGHSFSEKDPDFQVLTIQGKDKEGKPVSESRTICGPCAAKTKTNLGSARNAPVTELPDGE
jgi:hypothetical protein